MIRKYSDLLPSYLGGSNIQKHCSIMESVNNEINSMMEYLKLWNVLERPILIERVATYFSDGTMNIHIHLNSFIKKISISGEYTYLREYDESEMITSDTVTFTYSIAFPSPTFVVTVEDYDGNTYKKGYPENDTTQNNEYDHDEFLDIIGGILGISRRIYKEFDYTDINVLADTYPPYCVKTDTDGVLRSGTEDDYYYYQRLVYFIENKDSMSLGILMTKILYEQEVIDVFETGTESHIDIGTPYYYIYLIDERTVYSNIDSSAMNDILKSWLPITRPAWYTIQRGTILGLYGSYTDVPRNAFYLNYELLTDDNEAYFVDNAPLLFVVDNFDEEISRRTDVSSVNSSLACHRLHAPVVTGNPRVYVLYNGTSYLEESEALEVPVTFSDTYSLLVDDLEYNLTMSGSIAPVNNNLGELVIGASGCIQYIPLMEWEWYDDAIITISFEVTMTIYAGGSFPPCYMGVLLADSLDNLKKTPLSMNNMIWQAYNMGDYTLTVDLYNKTITEHVLNSTMTMDYTDKDEGTLYFIIVDNGGDPRTNQGRVTIKDISIEMANKLATTLTATTTSQIEGNASVTATLIDSNNNAVSGATIEAYNSNTLVASGVTDNAGEAVLDLSSLTEGTYNLSLTFGGTSSYEATTINHSITIEAIDPYDSLLSLDSWQGYNTSWVSNTNKPSISGTQITFNSTSHFIYTPYSLQDFLDATGSCRIIYKKGGGNGYANLTFANPSTGDELGLKWASSSAPYYKWVNTAESYAVTHNNQICYNVWSEVIITVENNNLVMTFHYQDGTNNSTTGYGVFTIPIGSIDLSEYYLDMYRGSGGTLYMNTNDSVIQHTATQS